MTRQEGEAGAIEAQRLSCNQITYEPWSLAEAVAGCARAGIGQIGIWRHKLAEVGVGEARRLVAGAGLSVSSLCRGGMFAAATAAGRAAAIADNRQALADAAALGAPVLVLVCGGLGGVALDEARAMVREGIAALVPDAARLGVRLGIEPLHPMFAADRSVVATLAQAADLAAAFDPGVVGVVIDAYHVWWDPALYPAIAALAGRIVGFHVSDWIVPLPDVLQGRGMMGDGCIELRRIEAAVRAAGYDGPIEVEIMNRSLWAEPGDVVLARVRERFLACL